MIVSRPTDNEYSPAAAGYVARITTDVDPVRALKQQRDEVLGLLRQVTEERATHRYAPGKWSVKQSVGHMADAERVFAYRLLRFARGDETALPGFDENLFVEGSPFDEIAYVDLVADWKAVREATLTLVAAIPEAAWLRRGVASERPASARGILYIILGHTDHHREVLIDRYGVVSPAS